MQLAVGREKQPVDVLGHALFGEHQRVVVGHAAHHHVALGDFLLAVAETESLEITLALVERERGHINLVRLAVVEAATVVDDVVNHPRGGRAANDEFDVVASRGPAVPKPFQRGDELGADSIQPRKFVNDDNLLPFGPMFQIGFQFVKGLNPRSGLCRFGEHPPQGKEEVGELVFHVSVLHTREGKTGLVADHLPNKEGLSHPPPTINGNKLRPIGFDIFLQLLAFQFPTYQFTLGFHHFSYFEICCKGKQKSCFSNFQY